MATRRFSLKQCTKAEDAVSGGKGQRTTKRKSSAAGRCHPRKGCSFAGETAFKKTDAAAGFSEVGKISKQKQGQEELAYDIKKEDGEPLSADEFDAFIAKMEEEHEKYWGEYTSDGVKRFNYKDYSSYPVNDDGFVVLRG